MELLIRDAYLLILHCEMLQIIYCIISVLCLHSYNAPCKRNTKYLPKVPILAHFNHIYLQSSKHQRLQEAKWNSA